MLVPLLAACPRQVDAPPSSPTPTATVTPVADVLSPFAAEVRWSTTGETVSPVAFDGGGGEETVTEPDAVTEHRVLLQGLAAGVEYTYRVGDGTGTTGTGSFTTPAAPAPPFRVLFDNSHGEQAGNADWVIDDNSPSPSPAAPSSEASWSGAYSAWGFALYDTARYQVQTLPGSGTLTFGTAGAQDLSNYCAVILPEPNNRISGAELQALESYVAAGGGLFLIADHEGSDRDNDGWESYTVLNELADLEQAWGWRFDAQDFTFPQQDDVVVDEREPLLHGPFGDVARVGFYGATSLRIVPADNPRMRPILWRPNQSGNAGLLIAAGFYGAGKVVLIGDSAPADDGTANPGNMNIFDSWNDGDEDNAAFFLNATAWLCDDAP